MLSKTKSTAVTKVGLAQMLRGGAIMDVAASTERDKDSARGVVPVVERTGGASHASGAQVRGNCLSGKGGRVLALTGAGRAPAESRQNFPRVERDQLFAFHPRAQISFGIKDRLSAELVVLEERSDAVVTKTHEHQRSLDLEALLFEVVAALANRKPRAD